MKRQFHPFSKFPAAVLCCCLFFIPSVLEAAPHPSHQTSAPAADPSLDPSFQDSVTIPGPLRSFLRMAGISQQAAPDRVLPLLAIKVFTDGYEGGRPTVYLELVERYLGQARELQAMAGSSGVIRAVGCSGMQPLLAVLGYRIVGRCGQPDASLVTSNADRAFLTVDSGFPLTKLTEALDHNSTFTYLYPTTRVPVIFHEGNWVYISSWRERGSEDLVDVLLHDPAVARLYLAISQLDSETRLSLLQSPGLTSLLPYAPILDFYGQELSIHNGRVQVPGGVAADRVWDKLAGARPTRTGAFVTHLLSKDNGWLALYFDTLFRVPPAEREHLTQPRRLQHLYEALRSPDPKENAGLGSYRRGAALLVLFSTLQWGAKGDPYLPGGLEAWKQILCDEAGCNRSRRLASIFEPWAADDGSQTHSKLVADYARRARHWRDAGQMLPALVAFSRIRSNDGPLQVYLALAAIDRERAASNRLSASTARLLASDFDRLSGWYPVFAEFPQLSNSSIELFVTAAGHVSGISNNELRANALGILQAEIGIWHILARQGEIPDGQLDRSWRQTVQPFVAISSPNQLLDAGRASLDELVTAAGGPSHPTEDQVIDLLAGPRQSAAEAEQIRAGLAKRMEAVIEDQRLASLDTVFALSDGLSAMEHGEKIGARLVPLAARIQEFQMPRPIFTQGEKSEWAAGVYTNRHAQLQTRVDLVKVVKDPHSTKEVERARGDLASFLRDTLVGLNYAYYQPPGSQLLHNNPLFVRSHDFARQTIISTEPVWQTPDLLGVGSPAGGGAYLVGSLAQLPYVLAAAEQDFIAPRNVQALIWQDLVPDLMVSAILPRWWNVSPQELEAVALYQASGEELLQAAAKDGQTRSKVVAILSNRLTPLMLERVERGISQGGAASIANLSPADTFMLAAGFLKDQPLNTMPQAPELEKLVQLRQKYPAETSVERISHDFGAPHLALLGTYSLQLEDRQLPPVFGGYYSSLFGQAWDSNNLYWARIANQLGYPPVVLNRLAPDLTRQMVSQIFATDIHDWPAVLRAMRSTGKQFLKRMTTGNEETAQESAPRQQPRAGGTAGGSSK